MWTRGLQVVAIGVLLQVPGCFPSCFFLGSAALCSSQNLRWVPTLPPSTTLLFLDRNYISEVNATSLSGLPLLQELDLGLQHVPLVIRNQAFSRQTHLRRLVLGLNVGLRLEPQAFVGLSGLQKLHLDHCSLENSILSENFLEPLISLETLNLFGNKINRLQPSMSFKNLTNLKDLNLKLNKIDHICEPDLAGFQGKHFTVLNLQSVQLVQNKSVDWQQCGNPFRGMSFEVLDLSHNGFTMAAAKQFFKAIEGTKISHLRFSGFMGRGFSFNNFPDPDHRMFQGLKNSSVRVLDLSNNWISTLKRSVFRSFREVRVIDLSKNKVNRINRNAFEGLQGHLKALNLSHNLLGEIYSHTFDSLQSLQVLDLSYNHIGALGYHSFHGLPHLKALILTGNALRDLGNPASLPSLAVLRLNDNKLSSVIGVGSFAAGTTDLDVRRNRLTNLHDVHTLLTQLKHLKNLSYGENTIRWCTLGSGPKGLTEFSALDLHGSSLQNIWSQGWCLNLFDHFDHVLTLNLSSNALQALPRGVFKGLSSLINLDLSSNALTYLQPEVFPKSLRVLYLNNNFIGSPDPTAFLSLRYLDLKLNRFHCDSHLSGFLTWLSQTNVTFLSPVEELRCEFPPSLYNVPLLAYGSKNH